MKDYLCKCNNCDEVFIDTNPQTNAIIHELTGNERKLTIQVDSDGEWFTGCPNCKDDGYLTDM